MSGMAWLIRTISWHRRMIAALLAALAMLALMTHLSAAGGASGHVVVTTRAVGAGHSITAADVTLQAIPQHLIPAGASGDLAGVVGRNAAVPLTSRTVVQPGLLVSGEPPARGRSLVPITVHDEQLRQLLSPGLRVSLVSATGEAAATVTQDAVVHAMPQLVQSSLMSSNQAALVLVDVPSGLAPEVSVLGQAGQLSVFLNG